MWRWLSTMKYFSPFRSYITLLYLAARLQIEANVLRCILGVGEHDDLVVEHDHAPVVGRHDLLEIVVAEILPAQRFGALLVVDLELAGAVDADHGGQHLDGDVLLAAHDLSHHVADLIVHQGDAGAIGDRAVRLEAIVSHQSSSFESMLKSERISSKRFCACSSDSSNRMTFSPGCDQIGCIARPASRLLGIHSFSQPFIVAWFSSPCCSSWASIPNSARVTRASRAVSDSPAPISVGVTKSPCGAAACMMNSERNSSPTSGSNTTVATKNASAQSRMPVIPSTFSRTPCQIGSLFQASLWASPSNPSTFSVSSRL